MNKHVPVIGLMGLMLTPMSHSQTTELSREAVIAIHQEFVDAVHDRNFSVYEKYLDANTEIFVDMDPAPGNELIKVELKEFKELALMSLQLAEEIEVVDDLLDVSINAQKNQATIRSRTTANITMLGTKITEISEGETVYGIRDGAIKVFKVSDEVLSHSIK